MRSLRYLFTTCAVLLLSVIVVSSVGATVLPPTYNSGTFGCDSVTFTYTASGTPVNFRVVDGSSLVVSSSVLGQATGTHTLTITLTPPQPAGTILQIQQDLFGWTNFGPATACTGSGDAGEDNEPPPPPRWEHFGGEDAYAAFRFVDDGPDNPVLVLLRIANDGEGSILFFMSKKMMEQDYPCTGALIEIFASDDGLYHLYRLPTCEYQVNVGPDIEGKTHVIGFGSIPPGDDVFSYSFYAGGPYMRRFDLDSLWS